MSPRNHTFALPRRHAFRGGMSVVVIGVGKRLAAEAAQDGDIVLSLAMVHQSVLAHKRRIFLRAEIARETFAMGVLDVLLQLCFGLAFRITLLTLEGKASLTVDVLFCLTRKFFTASFARHGDGLRASLIRAVRHCSGFLKYDNINLSSQTLEPKQ